MIDFETFVIAVYVLVDPIVSAQPAAARRCGRRPKLWPSEVVTLALISQLARFRSERDFYRYADAQLRSLFPQLPDRSQLNRAIRAQHELLTSCGRTLARQLGAQLAPYELLDGTVLPVRNRQRRGAGVRVESRAIGYSPRLGWVDGVRLLVCTTPDGVISGYGLAPANYNDLQLADTFLTQRAAPMQQVRSVGRAASGEYLADSGFAGREAQTRWAEVADAVVVAPPKTDSADRWPKAWRRIHAHLRQIIETVIDRLQHLLRLIHDRPQTLGGWFSRVAAKVAMHNALIAWNRQHDRPDLAVAEVIGW
jgi:hypothetical protein